MEVRAPFHSFNRILVRHRAAPIQARRILAARFGVSAKMKQVSSRRRCVRGARSASLLAAPRTLQLVGSDDFRVASSMLHKLSHPPSPVELTDGGHDRFPLGFRVREAHGIRQLIVGNVHVDLHDASLRPFGFQI